MPQRATPSRPFASAPNRAGPTRLFASVRQSGPISTQQRPPRRAANEPGPAADEVHEGPDAGTHQEEFGKLKLDCIHEETEWCSPRSSSSLQELYLSASELRSVSRKLDMTSAPDASCTTAHTRDQPSGPAARPVDDARSEFVLRDEDFLCCPEDLAAARNMWQPATHSSLERIDRCEAHPWALVAQETHLEPPISSLYLTLDLLY